MRPYFLLCVSLCFGLTTTIGCARRPLPNSAVIVVGVTSGPNNLDPRVAPDEVSQKVDQLIFGSLMELDGQLRVVPGLAARLDNPEPTKYVVTLRRGVRFHDGHELTSADVVYTFRSFLDPSFDSGRKGAYRVLTSVDALDRYAVAFTLKEPFGSFPINLVMAIVPDGAGPALRDHPIGTGPYRFVHYKVDDQIELAPFDEYYRGRPKNDGLLLKVVPDDIMRGLELRTGTMDIVVNDLAPDIVYQLRQDSRLQVIESPGTDYQYIGINLRDPVLKDRRVRQAIGYAIDREAIVTYLRRGLATPAVGILPPVSWASKADVFAFAHDPARARALLDEAGYRAPDGDGRAPRLYLSLKVSNLEFNRLQSSVIQENLREVGIALEVRTYEFATLSADVQHGNFQLFTLQWVGVSDPDMLRRVFDSRQVPPSGFNRGYFHDDRVDRLIDEASASTDDDRRRALYGEVQKLVALEAPYVSLWHKTNVAVAQRTLSGIHVPPVPDFTFLKDVWRTSPARQPTN